MNYFKFNVGDIVEVIVWDLSYGAYTDWFEENGLNNLLVRYRGNVLNGEKYKVVARRNHLMFSGVKLYAIEHLESKEIHLINEVGLKLVKEQGVKMTREEFDNLYLGKAVHCETEELAREFLDLADSAGYRWSLNNKLTEKTQWELFKDETIYKTMSYDMMGVSSIYNIDPRLALGAVKFQSLKNIPNFKEKDVYVSIEKYNELKDIIKDQYKKIDNQREHLKELNKHYNNRINEIKKMKKELKDYEQDLYQTRENERHLMQDIINLKNTLELEDKNIKTLNEEIKKLKGAMEFTIGMNNILEEKEKELTTKLETSKKEWLETFHELNEENKELKVLVYDLNKENQKLKEEKIK